MNSLCAAHLLNKFIHSSAYSAGKFILCSSKSSCWSEVILHSLRVLLNFSLNSSSVNMTKCTGVFVNNRTDFTTLRDSLNRESHTTNDNTILLMTAFPLFSGPLQVEVVFRKWNTSDKLRSPHLAEYLLTMLLFSSLKLCHYRYLFFFSHRHY